MASAARAPGSPRGPRADPSRPTRLSAGPRAHDGSLRAYEGPAIIENLDNAQFAPESISTGLRHAFVNASHANQVCSVLVPRMIRFDVRAEW